MIDTTVQTFGRLDVMVNNAGYHISKNIEETSEDEWEFINRTNLRSTFLCCKYAIPYLRKTKGNIINISSMVGLVGQPNAGAYSAIKGGQIAMSRGMALDFAKPRTASASTSSARAGSKPRWWRTGSASSRIRRPPGNTSTASIRWDASAPLRNAARRRCSWPATRIPPSLPASRSTSTAASPWGIEL